MLERIRWLEGRASESGGQQQLDRRFRAQRRCLVRSLLPSMTSSRCGRKGDTYGATMARPPHQKQRLPPVVAAHRLQRDIEDLPRIDPHPVQRDTSVLRMVVCTSDLVAHRHPCSRSANGPGQAPNGGTRTPIARDPVTSRAAGRSALRRRLPARPECESQGLQRHWCARRPRSLRSSASARARSTCCSGAHGLSGDIAISAARQKRGKRAVHTVISASRQSAHEYSRIRRGVPFALRAPPSAHPAWL